MAALQWPLIFFLVAHFYRFTSAYYIGIPEPTANSPAALKQPYNLTCQYTASDGTGEFLDWYKDDVPIDSDKSGHYEVQKTEKELILTIKVFAQADSEVNRWSVKTSKQGSEEPEKCQYNRINTLPTPQGMETNRPSEKIDSSTESIKRYIDEEVTVKCLVKPNRTDRHGRSRRIQWTFIKDNQTSKRLPEGVRLINDDEIVIKQVKTFHRGSYRCALNGVSLTVLLRVKDPWIALWPFLGTVSVVLTLIIIILIYEKRQKSIRQDAAREDEETDHVNDPLVRSSENESKKRAIKA